MSNPIWNRWGRARRPAPTAAQPEKPPGLPELPEEVERYVGHDVEQNVRVVRERFAAKAKRHIRRVPLAHETVSMYFCVLDPKTPLWVKGVAAAALAYFILPLDAVPDILPVLGYSDDATVLAAALTAVTSHITDEHRARASTWLNVEEFEPDAVARAH
ncbi:MAG: YkvA family protein [Isosphaeraceae bacterium]